MTQTQASISKDRNSTSPHYMNHFRTALFALIITFSASHLSADTANKAAESDTDPQAKAETASVENQDTEHASETADAADAEASETATEATETATDEPEEAVVDEAEEQLKALRKERELLQLENAVHQERLQAELRDLSEARTRLEAENTFERARLEAELRDRRLQLERLNVEIEESTKAAQLAGTLRKIELDAELEELRAEEERLRAANAVGQQRLESQLSALRLIDAELKMERQELEMRLARVQAEVQYREVSDVYRDRLQERPSYTKDVFTNGRLQISDRRIPLNGPIWGGTADHIQKRIDFYNNQSTEYPIFIVIDYSPGGSVMAGYRILKSMEGSQAPVYVVVRSFAASMAAAITTLSERSFAYPNAIILHHQVMWGGFGNLTQQRERLRETEEWWQRLATPIAEKMGIELDEFIKLMYERFSDGDWREFADRAVELNWVDHIVEEINEKSIDRNPDRFELPSAYALDLEERLDDKGNPYVRLPRLAPFDYYHLYNPDGYYRDR